MSATPPPATPPFPTSPAPTPPSPTSPAPTSPAPTSPAPTSPAENRLGAETSPYLLQHKDNPVHWLPWGPEALALARARNKPILLSIGYAACHWCHVMAHESFEDPAIAALMNDLFIPIKVDREERPDLDQIYQAALALLGQPGGWPLTLFLTPEGEPFWGGTYFPPAARFDRPGFPEVLRGVAATWLQEPDKVTRNVTALREALAGLAESKGAGALDPRMLDTIAERLIREVDPFHGGIGTEPKFPQTSIFELFWRAWKRTGRAPYRNAVVTTLAAMSQGGIYDHLGGGFARYAVDAEWLVPHFEKMLYDNALMIDLLTLVWLERRDPLLETRVRETVAWGEREMVAPGGGFASTLDADSEGKEGLFYVWSAAEIDRLLGAQERGADAALFKAAYDVTPEGNWEGANILNRRKRPEPGDAAVEARLAGLRAILWQARERRVRPGWDDKVLADWNGLMIAALANAGFVFVEPSWIDAAARAFAFVRDCMTVDGRLGHSWRQGQLKHAGTLDDYANMSRAALALFEVTGDTAGLDQARAWVAILDRHFWDRDQGGYFFTADDTETLLVRPKNAHDHATPSGNGTMVGVLARLYHLTGDSTYGDRAEALIEAFSGEVGRNFFPLATLLNNAELFYRPLQIVLVGPDTGTLKDVVRQRSLPNRLLTTVAPGATLPPGHPAHGKEAVEGRATAYVCTGMACSAPVTDPAALAARLDQLQAIPGMTPWPA